MCRCQQTTTNFDETILGELAIFLRVPVSSDSRWALHPSTSIVSLLPSPRLTLFPVTACKSQRCLCNLPRLRSVGSRGVSWNSSVRESRLRVAQSALYAVLCYWTCMPADAYRLK